MPITYHDQNPGASGLGFAHVTFDLTKHKVKIGGRIVLPGGGFDLDQSFTLVDGLTVFVRADGTLTTDSAADPIAHLAWWDGASLHVVRHV